MAYDVTQPVGRVRLLLSDVSEPYVFEDAEIAAFLDLEAGGDPTRYALVSVIKRAAAEAIDTNATNEALASKVLRSQDLATDGAKVADAMRKHADRLREQADRADAESDDGMYFEIIPADTGCL